MKLRELTEHQVLRGIALKHCCDDDAPDFAQDGHLQAHAHIAPGPYHNWICLRSMRHLNATTMRHELGHILSGEYEHNLAWSRAVRELGGEVERQYMEGLRKEMATLKRRQSPGKRRR